ncbi:MAG: hypothetical protein M1838_000051 [Thelocarpon superellum]|nr:MAG: hypothetical protein M1838_000051 [Thelocarpon superellum]
MADSDGEYVEERSDDEPRGQQLTRATGPGTRSVGRGAAPGAQPKARWEDIQRSWDNVLEGADGSISSAVAGLLEAGKRKRLLRDTTPLQRGIIRHLILVLDLSTAMLEKDLRPTRYLLTIRYAQEFVTEFFEQNPISQLGVIGMRDGLAVRISDMSGNPADHIAAIQVLRIQEATGQPSLQNALDMCRAALYHAPSHGTREVVVVFGALLSSDPGDIHHTIQALVTDKIRVGVVGLAAQVAICRELVVKTNGGDESAYGVALDEQHFRELLMESTTPPVTHMMEQSASSLLMMGFPSRIVETKASFCACHSKMTRGGYLCSRCSSKNWVEVPWKRAGRSTACFGCQTPFPAVPTDQTLAAKEAAAKATSGTSPSSRYECTVCRNHFCIDCDVFSHEVVHNCPGCQSIAWPEQETDGANEGVSAEQANDTSTESCRPSISRDLRGKRDYRNDNVLHVPIKMLQLLSLLLLVPLSISAASLAFVTPPNIAPSLPPSTVAQLRTLHHHYTAPLDRSGHFTFRNVSAGSYLLSVYSQPYVWTPLRIDVGDGVDATSELGRVKVYQTVPGIEWDNKGVELAQRPIELQLAGKKNFYTKREGFSPMSFLKNPMILLAVVSMGIMFGMPYLIDNMDPEMRAEFEEQSKKSPLTGGPAATNPLKDFDMAAWMAGTPAASSSGSSKKVEVGKAREGGSKRKA